jgi:hypothetical protein
VDKSVIFETVLAVHATQCSGKSNLVAAFCNGQSNLLAVNTVGCQFKDI